MEQRCGFLSVLGSTSRIAEKFRIDVNALGYPFLWPRDLRVEILCQ